uniref:Uncharacterized protein n=1 Tax=Oryza rufipogon TaxID=4529 RepID=A0A0E0PJT2_ORYRU
MDNGRTMIITGSEFTPEDAARIPKPKTKKEQGTTVQPIRQPMTVDNSGHNPSTLPPTPAPVEANHGRSNVTKDVHKSLLVPLPKCIIRSLHPKTKQVDYVATVVSQDIVSVIVLFQEQQRQFVVIHKLPALPMTPIDT